MTASTEPSGSLRPRILVSACFGFRACRYDGRILKNDAVATFLESCDCVEVCPEEELGLGTPRSKIRIILDGDEKKLIQPATNLDLTTEMVAFGRAFLGSCGSLDGAVLKGGSPSCGVGYTPLFADLVSHRKKGHTSGMFAALLENTRQDIPIVTECDLENASLRQRFWEDICTAAKKRDQNSLSFVMGSGSS